MGMTIVKDIDSIPEFRADHMEFQCFGEEYRIEWLFYKKITRKRDRAGFPDSRILEYFAKFGIRYEAHGILKGKIFQCALPGEYEEEYVMNISKEMMLGCLLYTTPYEKILLKDSYAWLLARPYIIPALRKKELYVIGNAYEWTDYSAIFFIQGLLKKDINVTIGGRTFHKSQEMECEEYLMDLRNKVRYLTRELDARVFDPEEHKVFEPHETTLMEYQKELQTEEVTDESFRNGIGKMKVIVNGKNFFNEAYRRYPIHQLLLINGEWKYQSFCSIRYSNFSELIEQILRPEEGIEEKDFNSIEENFALVLNCDETCEAEKYWEHICFFVRYTPKKKTIEICDQGKALLEFHELLQKSTDLPER